MSKKLFILLLLTQIILSQTKEEINQVKNYIKKTGMTEGQVKAEAKRQGFTDQDIKKYSDQMQSQKEVQKSDMENLDLKQKPNSNEFEKSNSVNNQAPESDMQKNSSFEDKGSKLEIIGEDALDIIDENSVVKDQIISSSSGNITYFGYDIFSRDPALFQATSVGVVDPDYIIGPGDEIIVMLWGETQFRQVLTVNREGFIFIPEVGQVFVNGLNLNLLESKLFRVLSQSYSSLNPQGRKATTFLDVSLGNLRPLRIQVLGEVSQPGAYTVSPSATLFSALYYFNGPTTLGTLRDIQLIRRGEKITSIDFYNYLLTGKKPKDEKLQLDDVIFIPKRMKTVTITGEINRPGIYEPDEDEDLMDIIEICGGLKITAYLDRAQIDRIVPFNQRTEIGMDRMFTDVDLSYLMQSGEKFKLQDGDRINIFSVQDQRQNVVQIDGAVVRPGSYDLGDSLRLSELIDKADSLLGDAYLDRVDIVRTNPDYSEELIKLDLRKALEGNLNHDIRLIGSDKVRVYGLTEMVPRKFVSISGHVKKPGRYPLQGKMTLYDLIFKAGGFIDSEFKKKAYLKRSELVRINKYSDEKEIIPFNLGLVLEKEDIASTILQPEDAVRIYSIVEVEGDKRYVSISGHVKRPGRYELFEGNMTLYDLIFKAGGYKDSEFKKKTYLDRAELVRVNIDSDEKELIPFNLGLVLKKEGIANKILLSQDNVTIYSNTEVEGDRRYVSISGHVKRPGEYELYEENMTIHDLLFKAGGFDDQLFRDNTYLKRADLLRFEEDRINMKVIPFNLNEVISNKNSPSNRLMIPGDEIRVYSKLIFNSIKKISIVGAVRNPGDFIYKKNMTIKDLILEAGGVEDNIYKYRAEVARVDPEILNDDVFAEIFLIDMLNDFSITNISHLNGNESDYDPKNFTLQPLDYVSLKPDPYFSMQKKVELSGAFYYPGTYVILGPNETLKDLILRAGGLKPNAHKEGARFIRRGKMVKVDINKVLKYSRSKHNIIVQAGDRLELDERPNLVQVLGEVNSPGFYQFIKGGRINDILNEAGGLTQKAEKGNIYIRFPNGKSYKYSRWIKNKKIIDGSIITVGKEEEKEPFNINQYLQEVTAIVASIAQTYVLILLARGS